MATTSIKSLPSWEASMLSAGMRQRPVKFKSAGMRKRPVKFKGCLRTNSVYGVHGCCIGAPTCPGGCSMARMTFRTGIFQGLVFVQDQLRGVLLVVVGCMPEVSQRVKPDVKSSKSQTSPLFSLQHYCLSKTKCGVLWW
ncbi:unnamed protein product [Leuciscus chuanchicus]